MASLPQLTPSFSVVFNSISVRGTLTSPHILTPFRVHGMRRMDLRHCSTFIIGGSRGNRKICLREKPLTTLNTTSKDSSDAVSFNASRRHFPQEITRRDKYAVSLGLRT